ncbi:MAG: 1,2-phenylacetyl-CoA epoxidase subunit PaaC [Gemmatimonadota bacterium]
MDDRTRGDLFEYLLRLGDDRLILGHRVSEWCGHGPILEEDIALANIALDLVGQANLLLQLAGEVEDRGRDQDALAYLRDSVGFRNVLLVETPNGDFGDTIVRQFLFSLHALLVLDQLQRSTHEALAGIAAKAVKETRYHVRHCGEWIVKLGDGTEESHDRVQRSLDRAWRYTGELFECDEIDARLVAQGIAVDPSVARESWDAQLCEVLALATLSAPTETHMQSGGRRGRHTEHLGHLLAEMQIVARSHPGAQW